MSSRPDRHAAEHALAIVALQAGDLSGAELTQAEAMRTGCPDCSALYADLEALRGTLALMPAPARRRDFRLTEADAARLRPSLLRQLVEWLTAPRSTVRPVATGLATLGLAGLLLTSLPAFPLLGSGAAAPAPALQVTMGPADVDALSGGTAEPAKAGSASQSAAPTQAPSPSTAPAMGGPQVPVPAPSRGEGFTSAGQPDETASESAAPGVVGRNSAEAARLEGGGAPGPNMAMLVSLALLVAGLGLFGARLAVRRALS